VDVGDEHPDLIHIAPAPFLTGLERPDERVAARVMMDRGVPVRRVVAAADVSAFQTDAKVKPYPAVA
jgi:hypothetical protein